MSYTPDRVDEINLLVRFNTASMQEGIKVHKSAGSQAVTAAERLYAKGLITQVDGGYLTNLGIEAASHAQALLQILAAV